MTTLSAKDALNKVAPEGYIPERSAFNPFAGMPRTQAELFKLSQLEARNGSLIGRVGGRDKDGADVVKSNDAFAMNWLDQMSESYKQAYRRFMETIEDSRNRLDQMEGEVSEALEASRRRLAEMNAKAVLLPNGKRAFVDELGNLVYEDRTALTAEDQEYVQQVTAGNLDEITRISLKESAERQTAELQALNDEILLKKQQLEELRSQAENRQFEDEEELREAEEKLEAEVSALEDRKNLILTGAGVPQARLASQADVKDEQTGAVQQAGSSANGPDDAEADLMAMMDMTDAEQPTQPASGVNGRTISLAADLDRSEGVKMASLQGKFGDAVHYTIPVEQETPISEADPGFNPARRATDATLG